MISEVEMGMPPWILGIFDLQNHGVERIWFRVFFDSDVMSRT